MNEKPRLGSLWENVSKKGTAYLSGSLYLPGGQTIKVVAFKAKKKEKPTSPDWTIYEKEAQGTQLPLTPPEPPKEYTKSPDDDDQIPF